jgi:hypothetical protein
MVESSALPVSTLVWQPRPATYWVTVVSKLTFVIRPTELALADAQEPISFHDAFWNDDPNRSLTSACDVIPSKSKCDVVVVGHAFAPGAKPVRSLVARVGFESIDKSVELVMDRSIGADGTIYQGQRFVRMSTAYERAAGGVGTANPVGIRHGARDSYGRSVLPNMVAVGRAEDMNGPFDPIGLGPVGQNWPQRTAYLPFGRTPPVLESLASEPIPDKFDFGFFNVAPLDQQCDEIPDDGALLLENLHREHPLVGAQLPGLRPRVMVERRGGSERPKLRADTVWIDTDRGLLMLTFRGHFPIEHPAETFRVKTELDKATTSWRTVQHETQPQERAQEAPALERHSEVTQHLAALSLPSGRETMLDSLEQHTAAKEFLAPEKTSAPGLSAAGLPFQSAARRGGLPFNEGSLPPPLPTGTEPPFPEPAKPPAFSWQPGLGPPVAAATSAGPATMIASSGPATMIASSGPATMIAPGTATMVKPGFSPPAFPPAFAPAAAPAPQPPPPTFAEPYRANEIKTVPPMAMPGVAPPPPGPSIIGASSAALAAPAPVGAPLAPPAVLPTHASAAALTGLVGASNAAADPKRPGAVPAAPRVIEGDVLHLIWFNPEIAPRIRRRPEWKKLLDKLEQGRFDPEVDEGAASDDPSDMEDRREVYEVIARGTPSGLDSVDNALLDAVRSDGRFAPQLLLLLGEVRFDFDEIEMLKATIATALPFAGTDEPLKKHIEAGTAFLGAPGLVASPEVAASMSGRIREAFLNSDRVVGPTFLDDQTERALLDRRSFQKRNVFGDPHIRGEFFFAGSSNGIPIYLPEALGKKLPLFRRLRMRTLVEAHFQADQYESHAAALKSVAIARIVR